MKIIINNNIYDITTFIQEHPGGPDVFKTIDVDKYNSQNVSDENVGIPDLTQKFNEVGHSEYAVNLLENYKVEELSEDDPRFNRSNTLEYNKSKISKLITHEDKFSIHKIMGCISLLNYFYLLFDCFYSGVNAELTFRTIDSGFIGLTWVHSILSLSALQFLIPRSRTGILPMIWQEFRAHSIVFAVRSFTLINVLYFISKKYDVDVNNITNSDNTQYNVFTSCVRLGFVLLAMKLADLSTEYLRENKKETTTATMPYWSDCPANIQSAIKYFYTHSQFMATFVCLFGKIPYILAVAFPIQFASFMMTLVRKNIISSFWYHMLYGGSLLAVYLINAADVNMYPVIIIGVLLIYLRVNIKLNKYVLWLIVGSIGILRHFVDFDITTTDMKTVGQIVVSLLVLYFYVFPKEYRDGVEWWWAEIRKYIFDTKQNREESNHRVVTNITLKTNERNENDLKHRNNMITIKLCEGFSKYKPGMYFNLYFDTKKRPYTPIEYIQNSATNNDEKSEKSENPEVISHVTKIKNQSVRHNGDGDIIKFLIKRVENGEVSPIICDKYLANNTIFIKGPFGRKYYDPTPSVKSFICDGSVITTKHIVMCSCGSGITPFYSMGVAWIKDYINENSNDSSIENGGEDNKNKNFQKLHFISSYAVLHDAILTKNKMLQTNNILIGNDNNYDDKICEKLFISRENNKLTPAILIDYINELDNDIVVFTCGTIKYNQMINDCCAITNVKCYEW
jgi:hypothetical protein